MTAQFSLFGETKEIPIIVYVNGKSTDLTEWDITLWVEKAEDYYSLSASEHKDKRVRIVTRENWIKVRRLESEASRSKEG